MYPERQCYPREEIRFISVDVEININSLAESMANDPSQRVSPTAPMTRIIDRTLHPLCELNVDNHESSIETLSRTRRTREGAADPYFCTS